MCTHLNRGGSLALASPDQQFNTVCLSKGHRSVTIAAKDEAVITVVLHFQG